MTQNAIYLDHNAAAPLLPEAGEALLAALDLTGNASSVHSHGRAVRETIETARGKVAAASGADARQVVFTASATEAITQAILGSVTGPGVDRIVVSAGEHSAVLKAAEVSGRPVATVGLDSDGRVDVSHLADILNTLDDAAETALVCVHWVNNETGVIQPMQQINALVGASRHLLFVDAVQAFGKLPLEFAASAPDMMAVSGHKIGGAPGAAALLMKAHTEAVRLIPGGGQEQGRRGGTEAVPVIAAFGAAADHFTSYYEADRLNDMTTALESGLRDLVPDLVIFGSDTDRIDNTSAFAVPGLKSTVALMALDLAGVSVSSGSACSSGKVGRSHVLASMGVAPHLSDAALRTSLGWSTTRADIDGFLAAFAAVLERRRSGRAA